LFLPTTITTTTHCARRSHTYPADRHRGVRRPRWPRQHHRTG